MERLHRSMIVRTASFLIAITLALSSCSRDREEAKPQEKKAIFEEKKEETQVVDIDSERIREEDIGIIEEFSPELFVKFTILYKNESKKWLEESASLEPEEQKQYFDEANITFFKRFGITEEEYINYGKEHIDELDKYMEEHPELLSTLQSY